MTIALTETPVESPTWRWAEPVVAVVALIVGLWNVWVPSFWRDESVSALAASRPIGELWDLLGQMDRVHALYYLLLRSVAWISTSEFALRLPSVLAMAAAAYGIAAIGRRLATARAGLLAGLVFTALPMVTRYAQEVRSYALVTALAVLATWLLVTRRSHILYAVVIVLLGWCHVYGLLLVAAHVFIAPDRRRFLQAMGIVAAGLIPLAVLAAGQRGVQLGWLRPPTWAAPPTLAQEVMGSKWGIIPLLALAAFGARGALGRVAGPWALVIPLSMVISLVYPIYSPRYVLFALPGLALLAGAGLDRLRPKPLAWIALALLTALTVPKQLWLRAPDHRPDDLRSMAAALLERQRPGDAVLYVDQNNKWFAAVYEDAYTNLIDITHTPLGDYDRVWVVSGGRKHQNSAFVETDQSYLALQKRYKARYYKDFGYSWFALYVQE
ncbi:glycosyltransferase family 39 protein [Herbidospora mongoliensis]|uniref:glycosyltransferase family 39 protein n=1 Tax=Herbidospora mongoliensis TaxID=688067 RepID=UPI0008353389|nr:glycosyltransferase family 39 protein [Herbidospora mongoliensis]